MSNPFVYMWVAEQCSIITNKIRKTHALLQTMSDSQWPKRTTVIWIKYFIKSAVRHLETKIKLAYWRSERVCENAWCDTDRIS